MPWDAEAIEDDSGVSVVYAWDVDDPQTRYLVYRIDEAAEQIEFFPRDDFILERVVLEGFTTLPPEFKETGYVLGGLQYYINKKMSGRQVDSLTISDVRDDMFRKVRGRDAYDVVLSYHSFQRLKRGLTAISTEAKQDRAAYVDEYFHDLFPRRFDRGSGSNARRRARRVVRNLDTSIISELRPDDVAKLVDFFADLLARRYTAQSSRQKLFAAAKVHVDHVALDDVVARFEDLLEENPPEVRWGKFLRENLFLVDSKYIGVIPELNVVLASQRRADFGLVDAEGYLDIFEIKRPSTRLLSPSLDRGNHYWHADAVKALVQAEKYLFNAERKADALETDIERERQIDVQLVRPKAVVVMGRSDQLVTRRMQDDFRILRSSLRHVEIVLYDELLARLRNQLTKVYVDPEIQLDKAIR